MVKIRYTDLPAGLHVAVQAQGRRTIIYLLPGLTADQRRAALARARSSGHMGQGPVLPPLALAAAVAADRTTTLVRNGAAAMRGHPMLLLPPLIVLVSSAIVFILTSFVTLTMGREPGVAGPAAPVPVIGTHPDPDRKHRLPDTGFHVATAPPPGVSSASPSPSNTTTPPGAPSSQPVPTPTITDPSSPTPTPSLVPTPTPTAVPSPTPTSSSSSACIKLGPLGLCVTI